MIRSSMMTACRKWVRRIVVRGLASIALTSPSRVVVMMLGLGMRCRVPRLRQTLDGGGLRVGGGDGRMLLQVVVARRLAGISPSRRIP